MTEPAPDITGLLKSWANGDDNALQELMPLVYGELRRIAAYHMQNEKADAVLEPTALVHEAYVRLVDQTKVQWNDRNHFYSVVARMIRRILVDYARARGTTKRGGGAVTLRLHETVVAPAERDLDLVALDDCLQDLARLDSQQSNIIEMRFFCGLSIEDTAAMLRISPATVKRDWAVARAWLFRELGRRCRTG
jgi:RNA polymerase sigma factor (TIGR02999 family)